MVSLKTNPASPYKIGDILTTTRTDLGDDWLLCDGSSYDKTLYPELYNIYGQLYGKLSSIEYNAFFTSTNVDFTNNRTLFYNIKYLNGYYVTFGSIGLKDASQVLHKKPCIIYSENIEDLYNPDKHTIVSEIWTSSNDSSTSYKSVIYDMIFANGKYIAVGQYDEGYSNSAKCARLAYADTLDGPWTIKDVCVGPTFDPYYADDTKIESIIYTGSTIVVYGFAMFKDETNNWYRYAVLATNSTNDLSNNWNIHKIDLGGYQDTTLTNLTLKMSTDKVMAYFYNIEGRSGNLSSQGKLKILYWDKATIESTLSSPQTLESSTIIDSNILDGFDYINGYYIGYGVNDIDGTIISSHPNNGSSIMGNSGKLIPHIAYSKNIEGPYNIVEILQNVSDPAISQDIIEYGTFINISNINYVGNYYIITALRGYNSIHATSSDYVYGENVLCYSTSLEDTWSVSNIKVKVSNYNHYIHKIINNNIITINNNGGITNKYVPLDKVTLPKLSIPTYIKAK